MIAPNTAVGPYLILEKVGEGGMGEVYKARDTRLNRFVAVKALPPDKVSDAPRRQRFLQEAQAASALNHPNIITVHDWVEQNGGFYLVMEYVTGKTLDHLISKRGLRLADTLKYSVQIADALSAAHAAGIVHRDIKPANIMVSDHGRVKVLDFGLAKLDELSPIAQDEATLTARAVSAEGTVAGSAPYMSPEQAEGKKIDARSDIFSFGAVLYEVVTGQRAFQGESRASTMAAVLKSDPKPAAQLAETLPKELDRIIARCLRKDLDRRSQSIAEIKLALDEIREESESGVQPVAAPVKARLPVIPLAAAGAVLLLAAGWWWLSSRHRPAAVAGPVYRLRQITRDDSNSGMPAVSPDGKLIAYQSNRGGQDDLWVQQLAGGDPMRLTNTPGSEYTPRFSPDGSQIAFSRIGGSSFLISALGGTERQIASNGFRPEFSPDGRQILYHTGDGSVDVPSPLMVISVTGGTARPILPMLSPGLETLWSPSGKRVLVPTYKLGSGQSRLAAEWHLGDTADGKMLRAAELESALASFQLEPFEPVAWLPGRNWIIARANRSGEAARHIWRIEMDEDGRLGSPPAQLTNGTGEQPGPPSSDGRIIPFASRIETSGIHEVPIDPIRLRSNGEPKALTRKEGFPRFPTISRDGTRMVFSANRSGSYDIWLMDLPSGKETALVSSPAEEPRGVISPAGDRVAFQRIENKKNAAYWTTIPAGEEHRICEDCRSLLHWTPDGAGVLVSEGQPETMAVHEVATGRRLPTASHPKFPIHNVAFSSDGKWIAFVLVRGNNDRGLYVAPWKREGPSKEPEWFNVANEKSLGRAFFSVDGNAVFYFRLDGGRRCLYGRRLNPGTKAPEGAEVEVRHFHGELSAPFLDQSIGYGLFGNKLYLPLGTWRSSVWVAEEVAK